MSFKFAEDIPSAVSKDEAGRLSELSAGKRVLEVGSHFGRSTIAIASTAGEVHAVDWHRGDIQAGHGNSLPQFLENLARYGVADKVSTYLGRIEKILPVLRPESFDMIFLDAQHDKQSVERDVKLILPLVVRGGVLAFHDYGIREFGITEVVDALCKAHGFRKEGVRTLMVVWTR